MTEIAETRAVIKFFVNCGLTNSQIHEWLEKGFGHNTVSLRTVETWAARFRAGRTSVEDDARSGRPAEEGCDALILSHIEENPNASVRSMSDVLGIPVTTVYRILTRLHFQYFKCKWVPHRLSDEQKCQRVERSKELLEKLGPMSDRQLANVITEDESWFCFSNGTDGQWRLCREDVDQNVSLTIGSKNS
jgi:histone-lysine N-methyltransferase SETMAR